ncbi:hypothetical protein SCA6_000583 [Theobroma cacao]
MFKLQSASFPEMRKAMMASSYLFIPVRGMLKLLHFQQIKELFFLWILEGEWTEFHLTFTCSVGKLTAIVFKVFGMYYQNLDFEDLSNSQNFTKADILSGIFFSGSSTKGPTTNQMRVCRPANTDLQLLCIAFEAAIWYLRSCAMKISSGLLPASGGGRMSLQHFPHASS